MRIGRSVGIGVVVVLVLAIGIIFYAVSSLDSLVAAAIEKHGSRTTGTPVNVSAVEIDLRSGQGSVRELSVANPAGFSAPNAFTLADISTKIDLASITEDPIVIDEIRVQAPHVTYEINKSGRSNIAALQDNLSESGGSGGAQTDTTDGQGPGLIIRTLVIESGEIDARVAAVPDKDLSAKLPRIELSNLGEDQGGVTARQVAKQVTSAILEHVGPAVADLGLNQYLGQSVKQAKEQLKGIKDQASESSSGALQEGKDKLEGLLGK